MLRYIIAPKHHEHTNAIMLKGRLLTNVFLHHYSMRCKEKFEKSDTSHSGYLRHRLLCNNINVSVSLTSNFNALQNALLYSNSYSALYAAANSTQLQSRHALTVNWQLILVHTLVFLDNCLCWYGFPFWFDLLIWYDFLRRWQAKCCIAEVSFGAAIRALTTRPSINTSFGIWTCYITIFPFFSVRFVIRALS